MELAKHDRAGIRDLISLHGHLTDEGDLDGLGALFTEDVAYDVSSLGGGVLRGPTAIREAALALGDASPVGHHVTNIVITPIDGRTARVRSKGIGIRADGTAGSVTYDDIVTRQPGGWKIRRRTVTARRAALGGHKPGAREILARYRQASVSQSAEGMTLLYAADAVHEFPFAPPGVPARLEGRDEIIRWITAGWANYPLKYERYRTRAIHDTTDAGTIIVEQETLGTSTDGGEFTLPSIVVFTVRAEQIICLRDYVNVAAAAAITGIDM